MGPHNQTINSSNNDEGIGKAPEIEKSWIVKQENHPPGNASFTI
jgi:hypothetical protein